MDKNMLEKYPWISFRIDLKALGYDAWLVLGECLSKCEQIRRVPLLPSVKKELHTVYLVKGVQATTAIEGNTLSEDQVRRILEGELTVEESKKYLEQEVRNVLEACNDITKGLADGRYSDLSSELLCQLNERVLRDVPCEEDVVAGQVRRHAVGVGPYKAPDAGDVQELLEEFCKWINGMETQDDKLDSVAFSILKAVAAHLYIAWIHPFGDGNGRTARLVEFMILLSSGVPSPAAHLLSNHYNATRVEYYRQLDRTSKSGGDVREFFKYAIQGFRDGLQDVIDFILGQVMAVSWEHYIFDKFRMLPSKPMHKRQRNVMIQLSRQGEPITRERFEEVTAKIYLEAKKQKNTFTRDLGALIGMDLILERDGKYEPNRGLILQHLPFSMP